MLAVEVDGLKKQYGKVRAVNGISFQVSVGETFGMIARMAPGFKHYYRISPY